ncbi:hypothetical protein [Streptomyces inusitatus]|uniref:hypothetical protein n=1 Tax=Streptomyces inusitatus TaxID=68221 RepID=UPI00167CFE1E|nr:hypothetical protein [Streptomyces inusitatus]
MRILLVPTPVCLYPGEAVIRISLWRQELEPLGVAADLGHQVVDGLGDPVDLQQHRGHVRVRGMQYQVGVLGVPVRKAVGDLGLPRQRRTEPGPGQHRHSRCLLVGVGLGGGPLSGSESGVPAGVVDGVRRIRRRRS